MGNGASTENIPLHALRSANIISLYLIANQDVVNCCRSYSVFWNGVHEQDLVCNMLIFR